MKLKTYIVARQQSHDMLNSEDLCLWRREGRGALIIPLNNTNEEIFTIANVVAQETKSSCLISLRKTAGSLARYATSLDYNIIIEMWAKPESNETLDIFCSDYRFYKTIESLKIPFKVSETRYYEGKHDEVLRFKPNLLWMDIIFGSNKWKYVEHLIYLISLLKRLKKGEYKTFNSTSKCVACSRFLDLASSPFNIPMCYDCTVHQGIDLVKIALEAKENKLSFQDYKDMARYVGKVDKCITCNKESFLNSTGLCFRCLDPHGKHSHLPWNIYLSRIKIEDLIEELKAEVKVPRGKCVDCGKKSVIEICIECEGKYDWFRIDNDIDYNVITWKTFVSSATVRKKYYIYRLNESSVVRITREFESITPTPITIQWDSSSPYTSSNNSGTVVNAMPSPTRRRGRGIFNRIVNETTDNSH